MSPYSIAEKFDIKQIFWFSWKFMQKTSCCMAIIFSRNFKVTFFSDILYMGYGPMRYISVSDRDENRFLLSGQYVCIGVTAK